MLKLIAFIINICLIIIILLQTTKENVGLSSFANKNNLFKRSPSSIEQLVKILTAFGILMYFGLAVRLNFLNM